MESQQVAMRTKQIVQLAVETETELLEDGYSGGKISFLLATIAGEILQEGASYVEIGVFRGASLLSVAKNSGVNCIGIDNFSLFDPEGMNEKIVRDRIAEANLENVEIINSDFEQALTNWSARAGNAAIGLLFVDGPHDYRSQLMALLLAEPYVVDSGVIVIDDANYQHVRQATWDFLSTSPGWSLLAEITTECHPAVQDNPDRQLAQRQGWSNGIHVIVRDRDETVRYEQSEDSNLQPFLLSHDVMRHRLGPVADVALNYADDRISDNFNNNNDSVPKVISEFLELNPDRSLSQNTETEGSVSIRFASLGSPAKES